jgi:small subunit ribosomal protein S4e
LITRGENAGKMGIVEDVRDGVFSLPKHAVVSLEEKLVELPVDMVMAVGFDKPILRVN